MEVVLAMVLWVAAAEMMFRAATGRVTVSMEEEMMGTGLEVKDTDVARAGASTKVV